MKKITTSKNHLHIDATGQHPIIRVIGEIDLSNAPTLKDMVMAAAPQQDEVHIDFSETEYLDSCTVDALLESRRELSGTGTRLILTYPKQRGPAQVFQLVRLDRFFIIKKP